MTELLLQWRGGDSAALERLIPLVYAEMRRRARHCLRGEQHATLQTTSLVNEVYLRLVRSSRVQWRDRVHFFAVVSQLMRRVLVDEARKRHYQKRGGEFVRVPLQESDAVSSGRDVDLVALDTALRQLAEVSPRKCQVVEMRFFGGLTLEETAAVLDVSVDTVKREWRTAKLWLAGELAGSRDGAHALA